MPTKEIPRVALEMVHTRRLETEARTVEVSITRGPTSMSKLTLKQDTFCREYIENGGNASEAYRSAYEAGGMKDAVIHVKASELLKNAKVAVRIEALQSGAARRHYTTIDSLVEELEEARIKAMAKKGGASAAVSATMGKAKLLGLIIDKNEHTGKDGAAVKAEITSKVEITEETIARLKALIG